MADIKQSKLIDSNEIEIYLKTAQISINMCANVSAHLCCAMRVLVTERHHVRARFYAENVT